MTGIVGLIASVLTLWQRRAAERRLLGQMEPWQLDDLGLTRRDVVRETEKRPWQA